MAPYQQQHQAPHHQSPHQQHHAPQHQHHHNNQPSSYDMRYSGAPITIESTTTVPIPERLIGVIIGKRGVKINQIRQQSGVRINIVEPQGGSSDHQIVLTGTPE
eukprot:Pgem_evm1s7343